MNKPFPRGSSDQNNSQPSEYFEGLATDISFSASQTISVIIMPYLYGEIFDRLGIRGMGHQGASWCELNSDGTLVLMAHQNYVHKKRGLWQYEMPNEGPMPPRSPSATKSLAMIGSYFAIDRKIILPVAVFVTDGGLRPDGTWEPSVFHHATGDVYEARMQKFDPASGYLLCDIDKRYSV